MATGPRIIVTAKPWPTNGHMIRDVARLGWIGTDDYTLDTTYQFGVWWKKWRPKNLVPNIWEKGGFDFRAIPYDDDTFDVVAFDPPYMAPGGRATSTVPGFNQRFGLHSSARTPADNQELINAGLVECVRVVRPGGIVLVKCMDYVSSGKFWPGTHLTYDAATAAGAVLEDKLIRLGRPRMQSKKRIRKDGTPSVQRHSRSNISVLLVLRKQSTGQGRQIPKMSTALAPKN